MSTKEELDHALQEAYAALDRVEAAVEEREFDLRTRGLAGHIAKPEAGIRLGPTERGFLRADFNDANSDRCSIQESSRDGDYLWLGQNSGNHCDGECMARMHLDRETVAELLPLLVRFVRTGRLRDEENETEEA